MTATTTRTSTDVSAADLLRRAHSTIYRWPPGFAGFRAALGLVVDGERWRGTVGVAPGPQVWLEVPGAGDEQLEWARRHLDSLVAHRQPATFAEGDGQYEISYAEDGSDGGADPRGVLLAVADRIDSTYRVQDDQITEITRRPPGVVVRVYPQHRVPVEDGRLLPRHLVSTLADPQTGRVRQVEVLDEQWGEMRDGLALPMRRRAITQTETGVAVRALEFEEHVPSAGPNGEADA